MRPLLLILGALAGLTAAAPAQAPTAPAPLRTTAEASGYRATMRHADVVDFLRTLRRRSQMVRLGSLGTSVEGRDLPLVIVANPPVATAAEARASGKLIAFAFGNIHAGEVCGKEALCMLARELALTSKHPLLKDLVVVFAPIYNADGNERFAKSHRANQDGPAEGMGQRRNAQGLDLNRDYVKLASPEARALLRFYREWDPALIIDTHTTNGSYHQYTLTYASPRNLAGDGAVIDYVRDTMLPAVSQRLEAASGYKSWFYGNFEQNHTRWTMYPAWPRYGTPFNGLRNRIAILSEAYAYASFKDRVLATQHFVRECLRFAAEHRGAIRSLIAGARARAIAAGRDPQPDDLVPIRSAPAAFPAKVQALGYEEEERDGKRVSTGKPKTYEVEFFGREEAGTSVRRPYAYVLPADFARRPAGQRVIHNLQRHGIDVELVREDLDVDCEIYTVDAIARADRPFEGHRTVALNTTAAAATRRVRAGSALVRMAQEHAALALYLLEPEAQDGLATWGFFDDGLALGGEFPVWRVPRPVPILRAPMPAPPDERVTGRRVTFADLYEHRPAPSFSGSTIGLPAWLDDGVHFLQSKEGRLRKVHAETGRVTSLYDTDALAAALEKLDGVDARTAARLAERVRPADVDPTQTTALVRHADDLWCCALDGSGAMRLTNTPTVKEELAEFSPDGKRVAFVRDYDLYVVETASGAERRLTSGGTDLVRNGKLDWVYFEELFGRNWKGFWWSPVSSHCVFLQLDDTEVGVFSVIDQIPTRQEREATRYPKAGDPNPAVKLGIVPAAGGPVAWVDLSGAGTNEFLVTRAGFLPDGKRIWFYLQDRAQTWLRLCTAPLSGGKPDVLFEETTGAWVSNRHAPHFLADGSFLFFSERTGWRHCYHYAPDGTLIRALTAGEWELTTFHRADEAGGRLYFSATKDHPLQRHLYRVKLSGEGAVERLTPLGATYRAAVAPGGAWFTASWSSPDRPAEVALIRSDDGTRVRTLDHNPVRALEEYELGALEQVRIPMADGFVLDGSILKPPGFDPSRRYPVWFMTYAGPHAPTMRGGWARRGFDELLAAMGIVVFRCDPRSASGKGAVSTWTAYKQLGVQEMADIAEAIGWLKRKPYVDGARIGMSGHSYGGFMTAYAMTHSKLFVAGIAGAPVTDWRNYDTIYTERYMQTPQVNPEGYRTTSVVRAAKHLHGVLLLAHGVRDDNVHVQNTLQLAHALEQADKRFEMMLYPKARHGIRGIHYRRLQVDFIRRHLLER